MPVTTIFKPLDYQPEALINGAGHMLRDMKTEAELFAPPGVLLRVRENSKGCRTSPHWGAWDVHFKSKGDKAGKCFVTFIHRHGTKFQ